MMDDVPSPIDLRCMPDALEWEQSAMSKRPWRTEVFAKFVAEIAAAPTKVHRVLEMGSGPGVLAKHVLEAFNDIAYVLLDFSPAMHQLARVRLVGFEDRVQFIERSFKEANWSEGLAKFQSVVTNQAVHELRHKRYATELHSQVREVLDPGGLYLVCDHFLAHGGMENAELYMSAEEQQRTLLDAGFIRVEQVLVKGGLVLHRATVGSAPRK
jgi:ubiquinone/menaquinone biosynthesis C-methylase UbiE